MSAPVVVVGGGLAGMAAAARLAKSGYPVELHERSDVLGGRWGDVGNVDLFEAYDPLTDTWRTLPPMPTRRGGLAAAALGGRQRLRCRQLLRLQSRPNEPRTR